MKQGRTPEEMLGELKRQSSEKRDYIVPSQSMVMSGDGQEIIVEGKGSDAYDAHYGMTDLFHRIHGCQSGTIISCCGRWITAAEGSRGRCYLNDTAGLIILRLRRHYSHRS